MEIIRLRPQPSPCLATVVCSAHILCLLSITLTAIDCILQAALYAVVCGSFIWQLRYHVLHVTANYPVELTWQANGDWQILPVCGDSYLASRWDTLLASRRVVILRFHHNERGRVNLVLCSDSLAGKNLRQLNIRLRSRHN